MSIYLYRDNQQDGPYEESVVLEWLQAGICSPNDLAICEGMTEWQPLSHVLEFRIPPRDKMKEFIIPENGLVVKTDQGSPILELSIQAEGNIVRMFGADGKPKIALAAYGDTGTLIIGDPLRSGVTITVSEDLSEIGIMNSDNRISLGIDETHSELGFVNANNAITAKIYVDENGGQIGLGDHEGSVMMSAGTGKGGGICHLMNKKGDTVVVLESNEENGNITLLDEDGNIRLMIRHKEDGNIHLIDKAGHIIWTTLQQ